MRDYLRRHIAMLMIAVLAYFVGGNTVFVHSHCYGGVLVVHSHPFAKDKTHHHTGPALALIAISNQAVQTMESTPAAAVDDAEAVAPTLLAPAPERNAESVDNQIVSLRAPPQMEALSSRA